MPFTLETWKAQVYERLWDWRLRLEQARPASVYSTLSAMALWPLVQAAQSEGIIPIARGPGERRGRGRRQPHCRAGAALA